MPAGRILANRGLEKFGHKITFSNCYVIEAPDDNIESIFDCNKKLARTFSYGGGCGIDIGKLRPKDSPVNNAAKTTSGAVSFMDLFSQTTDIIGQKGRRGALMISIPCDHPDIEEFIKVKSDLNKVTKANISVRVTDEFMNAVINDLDYNLSFELDSGEVISKIINAKKLFLLLAEMNHDNAEPGLLFWDKIEKWNLLSEDDKFKYAGVNPCAEEPLPAGGSCLLGSVNLSACVENEFTEKSYFNFKKFTDIVHYATIALNNILDDGLELHPLKEQRKSVGEWRQIGLGIMGLADMLIKLGIKYGSYDSLELCEKIGKHMINSALKSSALLAKEFGAYPKYNSKKIMMSQFLIQNATDETKKLIKQFGLRNSQLLTCAPTGTLSTMLGISGGIEPIYATSYTRTTKSLHPEDVDYKIYTPIVSRYMGLFNIANESDLPSYFVTSKDLNFSQRIKMQSCWQKYIDASISSTVNLPSNVTIEDVFNLYIEAWEYGLKGITIYRDGCARGGILSESNNDDSKFDYIVPISKENLGETYGTNVKLKVACGNLYLNVCKDKNGNIVEMFVNTSKGGICQSNINAISRLVSLCLRGGIKVEEVYEQLSGINCPACTIKRKSDKTIGKSCADTIVNYLFDKYKQNEKITVATDVNDDKNLCPECNQKLHMAEGCVTCQNCGFSKCG